MALPLPSPIKGYAPVTWDTQRISEVITELNAFKSTYDGHAGAHDGHSGIYSPSALQYYLETNNGGSGSTIQTISNATWTRLDVAGTVASNNGGGFNSSTDIYTIPAGGIYVCQALVRITDSFATNSNLGIGWYTNEQDGYWFQWNKIMPLNTGGGRLSVDYTRVASHAQGDQYRLYCFQDSGGNMALTAINLSVWRIG